MAEVDAMGWMTSAGRGEAGRAARACGRRIAAGSEDELDSRGGLNSAAA